MAKTRNNRTPESEMRIGALQVARSKSGGCVSTTDIKGEIGRYVNLTPQDVVISQTRAREPMYCQIVGNLVSHSSTSRQSLFVRGLATRTDDGLCITDLGREYLRKLGI